MVMKKRVFIKSLFIFDKGFLLFKKRLFVQNKKDLSFNIIETKNTYCTNIKAPEQKDILKKTYSSNNIVKVSYSSTKYIKVSYRSTKYIKVSFCTTHTFFEICRSSE